MAGAIKLVAFNAALQALAELTPKQPPSMAISKYGLAAASLAPLNAADLSPAAAVPVVPCKAPLKAADVSPAAAGAVAPCEAPLKAADLSPAAAVAVASSMVTIETVRDNESGESQLR
eukprot:CAMPEP_0180815414 /NCGR_PEP_ID=MMETSP1038_2-20121128/67608_1 /TAXON_ID=632150 /ORGANISM="Azadinium spinosum, Strain 3D9" /LENGTH=117 /DNA_ID=CAMNT_0022857175 /DNA_START=79 /DNA_END=430 /DNA_ORIENTATION=+